MGGSLTEGSRIKIAQVSRINDSTSPSTTKHATRTTCAARSRRPMAAVAACGRRGEASETMLAIVHLAHPQLDPMTMEFGAPL